MNTTKEILVTGSRNTMAMMRGVSCELASCTATNNADDTKTMNVNMEAAMVPSTAWAVLGLSPDSHPSSARHASRRSASHLRHIAPESGQAFGAAKQSREVS